jgi:hypothetical protein
MEIEISSTNPAVKAVITGTAPRPARLAAARGLLPLPQAELLEILVNLAVNEDKEISSTALATLDSQDPNELSGVVNSHEVAPSVLNFLARKKELPREVHESVIANQRTPGDALVDLAKNTSEGALLELIAINQQRLIDEARFF